MKKRRCARNWFAVVMLGAVLTLSIVTYCVLELATPLIYIKLKEPHRMQELPMQSSGADSPVLVTSAGAGLTPPSSSAAPSAGGALERPTTAPAMPQRDSRDAAVLRPLNSSSTTQRPTEPYCGSDKLETWRGVYKGIAPHGPDDHFSRAYEPDSNRTLLVEADLSAFNNIRLSLESAVCLAYKSRRWYRAPLINPKYGDGRLKFFSVVTGKARVKRDLYLFDYYDEASFRRIIPTLLLTEPLPKPIQEYQATSSNTLHGREPVPSLTAEKYTNIVFKGGNIHTRLLEQYAGSNSFEPHDTYVRLIESAMRLRQDIICRAIRRLEQHDLRPLGYVAIHMRRGDFDISYNKGNPDIKHDKVAKFVEPEVRGQIVLVITDTYDAQLVQDLTELSGAIRVVCWANIKREGDEQVFNAQIDMLSAVPAKRFIASPLSTFSTGIVRWRKQAGTHRVGDKVTFIRKFEYGYGGSWSSPGARGTWRRLAA